MATVQDLPQCGVKPDASIADDALVISGTSSLMPECRSLVEFSTKLYNKENLTSHHSKNPRWKYEHPELSEYYGMVPDMNRFDAQFFMIHPRLSHCTDAMSRKLFEQAYQALFDAGVCPTELSDKRVGVFIATGIAETDKLCSYATMVSGLLGCNRAMYANRISYCLNIRGPSYTVDASCCSSLIALEKGCEAIMRGECDSAIVGAVKGTLHPQPTIMYQRFIPLNSDGKTKCYDENADGQTVSEAVNAFYIQKYKDARRVYAEVCYVKNEYAQQLTEEYGERFGPFRDAAKLCRFFGEFYAEAGVSPSSVEYIEGCGIALPETDKAELQAVEEVFCKNRKNPLYIGSVTSNIGYTEAASGTCGLTKLLLAYQRGEIAANLHCSTPRRDIAALRDGRLQVLTEHQPFHRTYTAINGISVTGINVHALFKGHYKKKDLSHYQCNIPYLVTVSGRLDSGVHRLLDDLGSHVIDPEELALLHTFHKMRVARHTARGYGIFEPINNETATLSKYVVYHDGIKRPLWFVYSGMGSQWARMGARLMDIPIFAAAIQRCHNTLAPKGVDLIHIVTTPDKRIFDNILHAFVGITAIQIALTDVLKAVGLFPDRIIGHSVGELGCAYADGCCTLEEVILLSYYRGLVSIEIPLIRGSMAAIGIGYKKISKLCPPDIEVACHNGPDSSTISGPVDSVEKFVNVLQSQGVFAKEVNCANIAYHSRYVSPLGESLLNYSREVIKTPKLRNERWASTSVPKDKWNEPHAQYYTAEYNTNNLLSPVLFEETMSVIPSNAVLVELAPHGLLQAILKRSLPESCRQVPLTRRDHDDTVLFLLDAIGRLYMEGYDVDLCALYPKIEFPVSTDTRHISHLMSWDHTEKWNICLYVCAHRKYAAVYKPVITVYDKEYHFLLGSVIEGKRVVPFSAILVFVWDILAMSTDMPLRQLSVEFNNVHLYCQPQIHDNQSLRLTISLQRGSGRFEVSYEQYLIADGYIKACPKTKKFNTYPLPEAMDSCEMSNEDIYKMLFVRGYEYSGEFRSIYSSNISLTLAKLVWHGNWVTLLDGALHLNALRRNHNGVSQLQYINTINIDIDTHERCKITKDGNITLIDTKIYEIENVTRCGGLLINHIFFKDNPVQTKECVSLKYLSIIPFVQDSCVDVSITLYVFMQIIAENINKNMITLLNVTKETNAVELDKIQDLLHSSSEIELNIIQANCKQALEYLNGTDNKPDIVFFNNMDSENIFKSLCLALPDNTFIIKYGGVTKILFPVSLYNVVSIGGKDSSRLELVQWKTTEPKCTTSVTVYTTADYEGMQAARNSLSNQQRLHIITYYPGPAGLKDIVKKWRAGMDRNQICMTMIKAKNSREMNLEHLPHIYLAFNVLHEGIWGGEYYIPYKPEKIERTAAALKCTQFGDLSSLQWIEVAKSDISRDVITVHFAGLNAYDAKLATAELTNNKPDIGFGMDFSGITQRGEWVMGLISEGSARSEITLSTDSDLLWPVPKHWSLEDAATVPFAYCFAFYCLGIKSELSPGMNVLIHGGAGALGQAAISIALAKGCNVFTTVSDTKKKKFLKQMFPTLSGSQIGNSRDITFKDMILASTKRDGCQIIINCLKGELKAATLSCCASSGIIFDVAQIHTNENFQLGFSFINLVSYVLVDFPSIFTYQKREEIKRLRLLMSEGISRGYVRPLSRVTYPSQEAPRAFRLLAASQHRGRVLLYLKDMPIVQPRLIHSTDAAFLLLCDKEGFGLQLADKLISQGARKLHLHIQYQSAYHRYKLLSWQNLGIQLHISTDNLTLYENIMKLLNDTNRMGQVEGIFIIAEDTVINESQDMIISNVDTVSRKMCPYLRYFAVITKNGTTGVCVDRAQSNLPALTMQLDLKQFDYLGEIHENLEDNNAMPWHVAGDAIESALLSKKPAMSAYIQSNPNRGILDEVARITGLSVTKGINGRTTLEQVGIDHGRAQEMSNILEEKYNISIPKETIPQITIDELLKLQIQVMDIEKEVSGLSSYFNYVEPDEVLGSAEVIMMPTLVHRSDTHSDEFESNQTFLCIVPGLEGHQERFRMLCERIKLPTIVLQLGLERFDETIEEMAQRLVNVMVKKMKIKHFHLLGYEFGALLAFEMALILESYGITGNIYCLGGTPEDIRLTLEEKLNGMHGEILEGEVVKHMYYLMSGKTDQTELDKDLRMQRCFSDKVELCVNKLRGNVPYTTQYMKAIIKAAYTRIQLARKYIKEPYPLKANVILLRPILQTVESVIPKFSRQDISTYQLRSSLTYAPQDLRCAAIINNHIEPEYLEEFNKKNQCESFLSDENLCLITNVND